MKSFRNIAVAAILSVGAFSAIFYSSCSKTTTDPCSGVTCQNGGACSSGNCTCKTGIGGKVCDSVYRTMYANNYKGDGHDNGTPVQNHTNYVLSFTAATDTNYVNMNIKGTFSDGFIHFIAPIVLSNLTATGASFTITPTTYAGWNYSGTGTVNVTTATLTVTEDSAGYSTTNTFTSLIKQ